MPIKPLIHLHESVRHLYLTLEPATTQSIGLDLIVPEDIIFTRDEPFRLIDFKVVVQPPSGYYTILMPRSSTYKNWNIIQANSIGLIDPDYCGKNDTLKMPALWLPEDADVVRLTIPAGTRLAQILFYKHHYAEFEEFEPQYDSRGGIGSTGK